MTVDIRKKFLEEGIPFDELDPEMIQIIEILNFDFKLKTKFCCYGHKVGESTTIMFDDEVKDEQIVKLLPVVDSNVGTSEIRKVKLYKWARTMYQINYGKPWYPKMNWILEIEYIEENLKLKRLDKISRELKSSVASNFGKEK